MKFRLMFDPIVQITIGQAKKRLLKEISSSFNNHRPPNQLIWDIESDLDSIEWLGSINKPIDSCEWDDQNLTPYMVEQIELSQFSRAVLGINIRYKESIEFNQFKKTWNCYGN